MKKSLPAVLFLLPLFVFAFSGHSSESPAIQKTVPACPDQKEACKVEFRDPGSVAFTKNIFNALPGKKDNFFLSPFSIRTALNMTYEGASGQTAREMRDVLQLVNDSGIRRQQQRFISNKINQTNERYQLHTVNAIWVDNTARLMPEFESTITQTYQGSAKQVDFINNAEACRAVINAWVEEKTNDRIKDLIPQNALTPITRMVLTNAIYFKGTWQKAFDKDFTQEAPFYDQNRVAGKVLMMNKFDEESIFPYFEDQFAQYIELPYTGGTLSMQLILPAQMREEPMSDQGLLEHYLKIEKKLQQTRVDVALPKFTIENKFELAPVLIKLGMNSAFDDGAEFYHMCENESLKIASVIHQSFVEVNESGTEAAAATAVIMVATDSKVAPAIPSFRADRPFLFLIRHKETGEILFIGKKNKA